MKEKQPTIRSLIHELVEQSNQFCGLLKETQGAEVRVQFALVVLRYLRAVPDNDYLVVDVEAMMRDPLWNEAFEGLMPLCSVYYSVKRADRPARDTVAMFKKMNPKTNSKGNQ